MLALSRKAGQSILFNLPNGQVITVNIRDIQGRQVKISIDAPKEIRIIRNELKLKEVQNGTS